MRNSHMLFAIASPFLFVAVPLAFAATPESPISATPTPPDRVESSTITRVENWTTAQWKTAQKEWAKDETRWGDCRKQASVKKLTGRKSWSFLYGCMNG